MLTSALGYCNIHNIAKMSVGSNDFDGQAVCVKCQADARPKEGRTQVVEDPGEEFFQGKGSKAKVTIIDAQYNPTAKSVASGIGRAVVASAGLTLEEIVERAVSELGNLPMPKDIKQFKKVQKVIKTLQSLVESQNG